MGNILETVRDLVIIATGITGSIFALYKYKKTREAEGVLQIEIKLEAHKHSAKNLVEVSIEIKNVGKAASYISSDVYKHALFMVRKVCYPESNINLRWEHLEEQKLIDDVEYLDIYGSDYPDEPIIIEPNSTETYSVFFITDYFGPIWVRAELLDKDEYSWIANKLFILPKPYDILTE
jgi:hypothetical protein